MVFRAVFNFVKLYLSDGTCKTEGARKETLSCFRCQRLDKLIVGEEEQEH